MKPYLYTPTSLEPSRRKSEKAAAYAMACCQLAADPTTRFDSSFDYADKAATAVYESQA